MKRSQINEIIRRFEKLLCEYRFQVPPFLHFTPKEWKEKGEEYDEIRDNQLGWDVTDYGMGNYNEMGLALITLRNGNSKNPKYPKSYAEKIIMLEKDQVSPMHFHWNKMEDIINRGGGNLVCRLYKATKEGGFSTDEVEVFHDGRHYFVAPGTKIVLCPGESLTLYSGCYHEFTVDGSVVLMGEISEVNDDMTDNRFWQPIGRFPQIEEDEEPYRLLCTEYR